VEVGEEHLVQEGRQAEPDGGEAEQHAASRIEQQVLPTRPHERSRARSVSVGERVAGAKGRHVHAAW
jgi:hypothetical protein